MIDKANLQAFASSAQEEAHTAVVAGGQGCCGALAFRPVCYSIRKGELVGFHAVVDHSCSWT